IMIVNDTRKSYLLILDGPKDEKLFAAVAQAARPYLAGREQKMDLNITTSVSPLGQQGMRGSEPFYRKGIGRVIEDDDE
ncbi:enhanced serine sensitivity protein SseB C-terminal domain-containing protein, partial [Gemmiger formicilis]